MSSPREQLVLQLAEAAFALPDAQRAAYVADRTRGDPELRRRLDQLLRLDARPWALVDGEARGVAAPGAQPFRLEPGRRLGPFQIEREVGRGTTGVVYRARQGTPPRPVALKLLRPEFVLTHGRRFEDEGRALARLRHPGIAQVYAVGVLALPFGRVPYIAMEFVEGERLDACARATRERGGLSATLALFAALCEAIDYAHRHGVIHRDLKPANVLVERAVGQAPRPRVLDFSVARLLDASDDPPRTLDGQLIGTLDYMSPEQAAGEVVDNRTDVYALGVMLFEYLSGARPIDVRGRSLPAAIDLLQRQPPERLGRLCPHLPRDLEVIVEATLRKDPERRYRTARDLADDLGRLARHEPIRARRPTLRYRLARFLVRRRAAAAALLVMLLSGVLAFTALGYGLTRARAATNQMASIAAELAERLARLESVSGVGEVRAGALADLRGHVESLLRLEPGSPALRSALADVLSEQSSMALETGRFGECEQLRREALALREGVAAGRADPVVERKLARDIILVGDVMNRYDQPRAIELYLDALAIHERLAGPNALDAPVLSDLVWSYQRLGYLAVDRDDLAAGRRWLQRGVDLNDQRLARDPRSPDALYAAAHFAASLAHLASHEDRPAAALTAQEQRVALSRQLMEVASGNRNYAMNHACSLWALGHDVRDEDPERALELWAEAAATLDPLLAGDPDSQPYQHRWLCNERGRVELLIELGRRAEAWRLCRTRIEPFLAETLSPEMVGARSVKAHLLIAGLAAEFGDPERARRHADAAAVDFARIDPADADASEVARLRDQVLALRPG